MTLLKTSCTVLVLLADFAPLVNNDDRRHTLRHRLYASFCIMRILLSPPATILCTLCMHAARATLYMWRGASVVAQKVVGLLSSVRRAKDSIVILDTVRNKRKSIYKYS